MFSFFLPAPMVEGTRSVLGELRTWWFALAFVCIGLETKFVDLATMEGGRPAVAFLGAQAVNIVWTLLPICCSAASSSRYPISSDLKMAWSSSGMAAARLSSGRRISFRAISAAPAPADRRSAHRAARRAARRGGHAQGARRRARIRRRHVVRGCRRKDQCAARHRAPAARRAPVAEGPRLRATGRVAGREEMRALKPWAAFFGVWTRYRAREGLDSFARSRRGAHRRRARQGDPLPRDHRGADCRARSRAARADTELHERRLVGVLRGV